MNKVFNVNRSFDISGRSYIARKSKIVSNREAVNTLNDMYEMLERLVNNSSFQSNMPFESEEIESLLKRARGE